MEAAITAAQVAGAKAVIVINDRKGDLFMMGGDGNERQNRITISAFMVSAEAGLLLKKSAASGTSTAALGTQHFPFQKDPVPSYRVAAATKNAEVPCETQPIGEQNVATGDEQQKSTVEAARRSVVEPTRASISDTALTQGEIAEDFLPAPLLWGTVRRRHLAGLCVGRTYGMPLSDLEMRCRSKI